MKKGKKTARKVWKARYLYLMLVPLFIWLIIFHYGPMYGILLAFKKYRANAGIWGSQWVGLANFRRIFITPDSLKAIRNTVLISLGRIVFGFPPPIILAILINEMRGRKLKKVYQTIYTFPHFLSWVVVGVIMTNLLSTNGAVNTLMAGLGMEKVSFLTDKTLFVVMMFITGIWKGVGWSAIIYMAAIAGIDPALYEAARIDGASRLQQIRYITLSGISATISIVLILQIGQVMNAGFDQIFNMRNATVAGAVQILDTYVYDITFEATPNYGFSTAVGLFKSVINFTLLMTANVVVGRLTGQRLYSSE